MKISVEVEGGAEKQEGGASEGMRDGEIAAGNAVSSTDRPYVCGKAEELVEKSEVTENGELATETAIAGRVETEGVSAHDEDVARTGVASQEESKGVNESKEGAVCDRLEQETDTETPLPEESDEPGQQKDTVPLLPAGSDEPDQQRDTAAALPARSNEPGQQRDTEAPLAAGSDESGQQRQVEMTLAQSEGSRKNRSEGHVVGEGESPGEPSGHDASATPSSTVPDESLTQNS